ncbi:MAG: glycoside hydrolase family 28 protein [Sphingobacteriaceae bacterium]|nr:glycoside hydrolase family 28 protein [Sphingobacteriaceae bacterium]
MRIKLFLLCITACFNITYVSSADINISRYGAIGDGKTVNTKAIQTAIDECSKTGGGKVKFPEGVWVSGTILLKDNVTLSLDQKAIFLGSEDISDYSIVDGFKDGTGQEMGYCFVGALDAKNVGIEGKGTIDGRGKAVLASGGRARRPFLIRFVRCVDVSVKGVKMQASAAWTMHLFRCKGVKVQGLTIQSRGLANNDGIDVDCCEDVSIKNCNIDSGDDGICFKTTSPYPCKNIRVSDITISTNCAAIKMGTESAGNFENITVSDIHVVSAGLGAVKLLSVDGSNMKNINISNVSGDKVNVPIMIRLGGRLKTFRPQDVKQATGSIDNIKISNVKIKHATTGGILISGIPGHPVKGITLQNININLEGGGSVEDAKIRFEEKIADYPEVRMFGKVFPSYGLFLRHAENIILKNIQFSTDKPDARPAVLAEDINQLVFSKWVLPASVSAEPVMRLASVKNANFNKVTIPSEPALFFNVAGADSKNIIIAADLLSNDKNKIRTGIEVQNGAVIIK